MFLVELILLRIYLFFYFSRKTNLHKIFYAIFEWKNNYKSLLTFDNYINNFIPNYYDLDPTEQGIYFNHINRGVKFIRDNVFSKYSKGKVSGVVLRKIAHQRLIGWNVVPTDIDIILERLLSFILDEEADEYKELRSILRYVLLQDCMRYKKEFGEDRFKSGNKKKVFCIKKFLTFVLEFLERHKSKEAKRLLRTIYELKEFDILVKKLG